MKAVKPTVAPVLVAMTAAVVKQTGHMMLLSMLAKRVTWAFARVDSGHMSCHPSSIPLISFDVRSMVDRSS
jgi:hypothetical protein